MDSNLIDDLVDGCKKKSLKSQEELYKHFFGYALSIGIRYIGDRNEGIEIVDDSFMKVFDKIETYNTDISFKAWLRKIVINTAIDKIRGQEYNKNVRKLNGFDVLHKSDNNADCEVNLQDMLCLLKKIQTQHKTVFNLFEIEGYNHKEIAEFLNIPESSSRTYLTRAKKELRTLYEKYF